KPPDSPTALARRYENALKQALREWGKPFSQNSRDQAQNLELRRARLQFLSRLIQDNLLTIPPTNRLVGLLGEYRKLQASIPQPTFVPAMADGNGLDEHIFIRGNHKSPGELVPRRFLAALSDDQTAPFISGSGRLELAERITDDSDPFLARVLVNRVWLHLFG